MKDFQLSTNYLVTATVRLENRSAQPLALPAQEWVVGTATPMGARDNGQAVGVLWYNGAKTEEVGGSLLTSRAACRQPRVPPLEYRGGASNVVWAAAHNQFFALAAMPQQPGPGARHPPNRLAPPHRRGGRPGRHQRAAARKATRRRWSIPR